MNATGFLTLLGLLAPLTAAAADADGCHDSPLIARFPGSTLDSCRDRGDDLVDLPLQDGHQRFEGELHTSSYTFPRTSSKAEVYRNLKTALTKAGFTVDYDSGPDNGDFTAHHGSTWISESVSISSSYSQAVAMQVPLKQVVTANLNGRYAALKDQALAGHDVDGCVDSPLVTRFPGSVIESCQDKPDDTTELPLAKGKKTFEGEIHHTLYDYPPSASKAQVYRNLLAAMRSAGFTIEYETDPGTGDFVARSGKTWVYEAVSVNRDYEQTVVVEVGLTQEVTANAEALSGGLSRTGHVAVYGILFDTGKADIKPSSAAALKEIVKLLSKEPGLKLWVVGHTDTVGDVASNLDLSRRRAEAVVHALVTQYGVSPQALDAFGAGAYCPVATNDREPNGRALNRRVELVKR